MIKAAPRCLRQSSTRIDLSAPLTIPEIECVYANAKHIRRDKAILRRVQPDHTDDETVDARNDETGPHPSAARRRAMVRPMPRDAPVTIAVFVMVVLLFGGFFELEVRR
jgi:hypothetical protein